MLSKSDLKVVRVPCVIAAIVAAKKVGKEVHVDWLAVVPSLRQAQAERVWCFPNHLYARLAQS